MSEWSALQRDHFGLTDAIDPWCISGDIGIRKPDARAYNALLETIKADAHECLFVDDRQQNVVAARTIGFEAVLYGSRELASLVHLQNKLR